MVTISGNGFAVCCLHYPTRGLFVLRCLWENKTEQNKKPAPPFSPLPPALEIALDPEKSSRTESHPLSEPF